MGAVGRISFQYRFHMRHVDVFLDIGDRDLDATKAGRAAVSNLRRQLASLGPHLVLPCVHGAMLPIFPEVRFGELGQQKLPRRIECRACCVERLGDPAGA